MGFRDLINKAGKRSSSEVEEEYIDNTAEEENNENDDVYDIDSAYEEDNTDETESDDIYMQAKMYMNQVRKYTLEQINRMIAYMTR